MPYFIDTNIFLRTLIADNKTQYGECVALLELLKKNKIEAYTSSLVLAEINWTLSSYYEFPKQEVIKALKSIINLRGLKIIDEYNHQTTLNQYEKYHVKYIDCLLSSSSGIQNKNAVIISYDRDFDKLNLLKKEPGDIIKE